MRYHGSMLSSVPPRVRDLKLFYSGGVRCLSPELKCPNQRRSEERNATRPSARENSSAPPNAAGGVLFLELQTCHPDGVKPVKAFLHSFGSWWIVQTPKLVQRVLFMLTAPLTLIAFLMKQWKS